MEDERQKKVEENRARAEAELKADLRETFLRFNPATDERDFEREYPELRAEAMKREAVEGPIREKQAALQRLPVELRSF